MEVYKRIFFLVAILQLTRSREVKQQQPTVTIPQGSIAGSLMSSRDGRPIYAFQGIPYAEAPIGDLRFKHPQEKKPWGNVTLKATRSVKCIQKELVIGYLVVGEEDCLVVNVYTNQLPKENSQENKLRPVMFFIHGGGFVFGDGTPEFYGPEYFLDEDVVLVTFNYRLGPLGFLSMGDDVLPANLGMWDQLLALKWVQKNIIFFGGDPDRVTIFGESAGSMSVMLHISSPKSKGLFHGAIAQSGVANAAYMVSDKHPAYYARTLAGRLGCDPKGTSSDIKECLLKIDGLTIIKESNLFDKFLIMPTYFKPVVDGYFSSDPFLPKEPVEIFNTGSFNHVPTILGCNKDEGLVIGAHLLKEEKKMEELNQDYEDNMALLLFGREADEISERERKIVGDIIRQDFGGKKLEAESIKKFSDIFGDAGYFASATTTAQKMAEKSSQPVFHYLYTHKGTVSLADYIALPKWKLTLQTLGKFVGLDLFRTKLGVCHLDEIFLMFKAGMLLHEATETEEDLMTSRNLVKLWTNFAKLKDPTPDEKEFGGVTWWRVDPKQQKMMRIDAELKFGELSEDEVARVRRWEGYWKEIPPTLHLRNRSVTWNDTEMFDVVRTRAQPKKNFNPFSILN